MSDDEAYSQSRNPVADYAIDLAHNGISLYERLDVANWKCVETIPLQIGTLARKFAHLRLLAGGHDNIRPMVEVWLPLDEITIALIDFSRFSDMERAVFDTFSDLGCANPHGMSFDFEPAQTDGKTPVAGVPVEVLQEAHDFLATHGFEISSYTTAKLPEKFKRPPDFPLYQAAKTDEPAPVTVVIESAPIAAPIEAAPKSELPKPLVEPAPAPVVEVKPAAPEPTPVVQAETPVETVAPSPVKPRTAPNARPKPALQASAASQIETPVPLATKLLAGGAVAAMLTLAVVGLPKLLTPADARYLPDEDKQTAATLAQPDEVIASAGILTTAANAPFHTPLIAPDLAAVTDTAPSVLNVDTDFSEFSTQTRAQTLSAPTIEDANLVMPSATRLSFQTTLPQMPGQIDPALAFGRFESDIQLSAAVLEYSDTDTPVNLTTRVSRASNDLAPIFLRPSVIARSDPAMHIAHFEGALQSTLTAIAPLKIAAIETGPNLKRSRADSALNSARPFRAERLDPALRMGHFESGLVTQPDSLAKYTDTTSVDLIGFKLPATAVEITSDRTPIQITRADPSQNMNHFEGTITHLISTLSKPADHQVQAKNPFKAQAPEFGPVRSVASLSYLDPTTRLGIFEGKLQLDIARLVDLSVEDTLSRSANISNLTPVRVASLQKLDLVDSHTTDKIAASAKIIQPFAGFAPKTDNLLADGMELPSTRLATQPIISVASLTLEDAVPVSNPGSAEITAPTRIPLGDLGRSIVDGGMLTPDDPPVAGKVPGLQNLNRVNPTKPFVQLAALTSAGDTPLAAQPSPPPPPEPERTVTDTHILVVSSRPDVLPKFRPRADTVDIAVNPVIDSPTLTAPKVDDAELPLVAIISTRPDVVPPTRFTAPLPTITDENGLIAISRERPDIVPPLRSENPGEKSETITKSGVLVIASLPDIVPPNRFGAGKADDSTLLVQEPTEEQLTIAAMIIKAQREGDLEPTSFALQKASAPSRRPAGMVAAAKAREIELASLLPSDLALTAATSPKSRPRTLKVIKPARTLASVNPNTEIKPSSFNPGPQLPTVANVARSATISNALPMRQLALIGVYGSSKNRHALVRTPNGRFIKVSKGDSISGYKVSAISADAIRLNKRGKDTLLVIPD